MGFFLLFVIVVFPDHTHLLFLLYYKHDRGFRATIKRVSKRETSLKVSKGAKIRNRYNQVPYLTQDTNGKVTNSQQTPQTRAKRSALSHLNPIFDLLVLTHLCRMEFPTVMSWTRPFPILGLLVVVLVFVQIMKNALSKQWKT